MDSPRIELRRGFLIPLVILLLASCSISFSQSIIQMPTENNKIGQSRTLDLYCEAWRFTVETNDVEIWSRIPSRCTDFVKDYITGDLCRAESEAVADISLAYAKEVKLSGDGKDAWVFDVDETLLSNVPYYQLHGFGSEIFDEVSFDNWVALSDAPALPASLRLYKELQDLGFTIFVLTGRSEFQRNVTGDNLRSVGYYDWNSLLLRGDSDQGKPAAVFKSKKRKELEDEGYIIHGNSGDQWSDLVGYSVGRKSFKLPNPLYCVP